MTIPAAGLPGRAVGTLGGILPHVAGGECVQVETDTDGSSDGTMHAGYGPWILCLIQTAAGWRLYDQGPV